VAEVVVTPESLQLVEGTTAPLSATPLDAGGQVLAGREVTWATSDASVASVSPGGVVTAVAPGAVTITATVEGRTAHAAGLVVLSRSSVSEIVRTEIIEAQWNDRFVLGLVTPEPLARGTVVGTTATEGAEGAESVFSIDGPAYFAFVDLVPTHLFEHPALYVLVDAVTGEITEATRYLPPALDGAPIWPTFDGRIGSTDRFEPASLEQPLKPVIPVTRDGAEEAAPALRIVQAPPRTAATETWAPTQGAGQKRAFAIAGGDDDYFGPSRDDMTTVLERFGFAVTEFDSSDDPLANVVRDILEQTSSMGPEDEVVIYLVGHGGQNGFYYGFEQAVNSRRWLYRTGPGSLSLPENSLPAFLAMIPAGKVTVILDTCHAETLQRSMDAQGFKPRPGVTLDIFASAKSTESARGPRLGESMLEWAGLGGTIEYRAQYTEGITENIQGDTDFGAAFADAHQTQKSLDQKPREASFSTRPVRTVFTTSPELIDIYAGQTFTIEGSTEWDDGSTTPAAFQLESLPPGVDIVSDSFLEDRRRIRFRGLRAGDVTLRLNYGDRGAPATEVVPVTIRPVEVSVLPDSRFFEGGGELRTVILPGETFQIQLVATGLGGCPSPGGGWAIDAEVAGDFQAFAFEGLELGPYEPGKAPPRLPTGSAAAAGQGCPPADDAVLSARIAATGLGADPPPLLSIRYRALGDEPYRDARAAFLAWRNDPTQLPFGGVPHNVRIVPTASSCGEVPPGEFHTTVDLARGGAGGLQLVQSDGTIFEGALNPDGSGIWEYVSPGLTVVPGVEAVETVSLTHAFVRRPDGTLGFSSVGTSRIDFIQLADGAILCSESADWTGLSSVDLSLRLASIW
jgi:hypothetical protein